MVALRQFLSSSLAVHVVIAVANAVFVFVLVVAVVVVKSEAVVGLETAVAVVEAVAGV